MKIEIGSGVYLLVVLALAVLKVAGILSISWLWVLCPIWAPFAFVLAILGLVFGFILIIFLLVLILIIPIAPFALIVWIIVQLLDR